MFVGKLSGMYRNSLQYIFKPFLCYSQFSLSNNNNLKFNIQLQYLIYLFSQIIDYFKILWELIINII